MTAVIGNVVKSGLTNIVTGLTWIGAPVVATSEWNTAVAPVDFIGISNKRYLAIKPSTVGIRVETIIGDSESINVDNGNFTNLADYVDGLLTNGYWAPDPAINNQALLESIQVNFSAGQTMTATFNHIIPRPTVEIQEWFKTYTSNELPDGSGEELRALTTGQTLVRAHNQSPIEGIYNASISTQIQWNNIETRSCRGIYVPGPLRVNLSFDAYNDYFIDNKSWFTYQPGYEFTDLYVWQFRVVKPQFYAANQTNPSSGMRAWSVNLIGKNLIRGS